MTDTEFYLPYTSTDRKIENLMKYKFGHEDNHYLSIFYKDFIAEEGMIKCSYEYYLDENDVDYLLNLISEKYGVKDKKDLISIYRLFNGDSPDYDYYDEFDILDVCWGDLQKYEAEIFAELHSHCLNKAKEEFLIAFDYWLDDDQKADYYEYEEV